MTQRPFKVKITQSYRGCTLYVAMELSNKQRRLVFGDGIKRRRVTVEVGYREQQRADAHPVAR